MDFTEEMKARYGGDPEREFRTLDRTTQRVVRAIDLLARLLFGKHALITSMRRDGLHSTGRMVDLDVDEKGAYGGLLPAEWRVVRGIVNEAWQYDPERPSYVVLLYGENDPAGKHYNHAHAQTSWGDRTVARNARLVAWLDQIEEVDNA